jgi:hypothetical protein
MPINPLGPAAGVAGTPLAQAKGADLERTHGEVAAARRRVYHNQKAEAAAGVGEPDGENHEIADRNGDGRRPWEQPPSVDPSQQEQEDVERQSKDPSHQRGNLLDLSG